MEKKNYAIYIQKKYTIYAFFGMQVYHKNKGVRRNLHLCWYPQMAGVRYFLIPLYNTYCGGNWVG